MFVKEIYWLKNLWTTALTITPHRRKLNRLMYTAKLRVRDTDPAVAIKGIVREAWCSRWEAWSSIYLRWACLLNKNIIFEERESFWNGNGRKIVFPFPVSGEARQWIRHGIKAEKFSEDDLSLHPPHGHFFLPSWVTPSWSSILHPSDPSGVPRFAEQENTHRVRSLVLLLSTWIPQYISTRLRKHASSLTPEGRAFVLATFVRTCYNPWRSKMEWCTQETPIKQSDRPALLSAHVQHITRRRKCWAPQ